MSKYGTWIQSFTERILTKRLYNIALQKEQKQIKKTIKGEILGWLDAIVFAVFFVLIINQYLFQLFMIPSPSMVETLNIKDRVFVSKTSYGIELYPTGPKILDKKTPLRDDVIVFYNPEYDSKGPLFDILSQIIYMGTFSLVNIDVDEEGNMRERLYVKRAAAMGGDTVRFQEGTAMIWAPGFDSYIPDPQFRAEHALSLAPHQSIDPTLYPGIQAYGALLAYQEEQLSSLAPQHIVQAYQKISSYRGLIDFHEVSASKQKTHHQLHPYDMQKRSQAAIYALGHYVPHGSILPLGDNRDNSQDGRYFGPVSHESIIGRVLFRFWPLGRMGRVS